MVCVGLLVRASVCVLDVCLYLTLYMLPLRHS